MADLRWRRSSRSTNGGGNCVEIAVEDGAVVIRDSKSADGVGLRVDRDSWADFIAAVKAGEFDVTRPGGFDVGTQPPPG